MRELEPELALTMKVAVLSAAGRTRAQMAETLACEDVEVRMALARLRRVGEKWQSC